VIDVVLTSLLVLAFVAVGAVAVRLAVRVFNGEA
jgi:hypothetical protein